jgi:hypothetical protein
MLKSASRATADGALEVSANHHQSSNGSDPPPKGKAPSYGRSPCDSKLPRAPQPAYSAAERKQDHAERMLQLLCLIAQSLHRIEAHLSNQHNDVVPFLMGGER